MNLFESLQSFLFNITHFKILFFIGNHQFHGKKILKLKFTENKTDSKKTFLFYGFVQVITDCIPN